MAAWATKEQDARPAEAVGTVPLLEMRDIRKSFFGVEALKGVDLVCFPGEVRAIVGENGAGKSTLMKILAGVHRADAGTIRIGGQAMHLRHPRDAQMNGVSIIYQELRLLPERSVAENVFLGREPARRGLVDAGALARATADLLARLGMARAIAPEMLVRHLSVAQQQMVEIAKALSWGARIVVMDEPTAALSHHEVEALFTQVEALRAAGLAVVYISHRLNEVFRLAQRITVLKDGVTVADVAATDITSEQLVEKMVGRKLDAYEPRVSRDAGEVRVRVRDGNNRRLAGVQLTLHAGEILGVAGLEGSGRTELARALFGDAPLTSGTAEIDGRPVALSSPRAAIGAGIGFLTEDRKSEGILPDESVLDNARLALRALGRRWRRARGVNGATASMVALMRDIDVRAASWDTPVQYL
ncbi:MAG TPA: sugar ABC transporter ATP-binding protein, partial [Polyangiaceae bacterium]|nr:sugar ABC transporter ATP-binding protein [Polyangiaceae bacterium]